MYKQVTEDQLWRICRDNFSIQYDVIAHRFILADCRYDHWGYVIPDYLPIFKNGEILNPVTFLEDYDGKLRKALHADFGAFSRLRYMIGHSRLEASEEMPCDYFYPAHYLTTNTAIATEILTIIEYDCRLGRDVQCPVEAAKGEPAEWGAGAIIFSGEARAGREVMTVTFKINDSARRHFANKVLRRLQQVVEDSDPILQRFEAEKAHYRKLFEEAIKLADHKTPELIFEDDELCIKYSTSPGSNVSDHCRYDSEGFFQLCTDSVLFEKGLRNRKILNFLFAHLPQGPDLPSIPGLEIPEELRRK